MNHTPTQPTKGRPLRITAVLFKGFRRKALEIGCLRRSNVSRQYFPIILDIDSSLTGCAIKPGPAASHALQGNNTGAGRCGRREVRISSGVSADAAAFPASGGSLAVRTIALPEDREANDAVLRLLAKALDHPVSTWSWCAVPPVGTN